MFSSIGRPTLYPVYASREVYDLTLKHSSFFLYGGIRHTICLYTSILKQCMAFLSWRSFLSSEIPYPLQPIKSQEKRQE
jgi:hypothetical protein